MKIKELDLAVDEFLAAETPTSSDAAVKKILKFLQKRPASILKPYNNLLDDLIHKSPGCKEKYRDKLKEKLSEIKYTTCDMVGINAQNAVGTILCKITELTEQQSWLKAWALCAAKAGFPENIRGGVD